LLLYDDEGYELGILKKGSPSGAFEPFVVHYVETFIVPAHVGEYTISPYGESKGQQCATLKAIVRT